MIDIRNCKYGDKLITKNGQAGIYLGRTRPFNHAVISGYYEILNTVEFRTYSDNGIVVGKDGKPDSKYRDEEIVGIHKCSNVDLSRCKPGDRFVTKCGAAVRFVGFDNKTGYFKIEVIEEFIRNIKFLSCDKDGNVPDTALSEFELIEKIGGLNDKSE